MGVIKEKIELQGKMADAQLKIAAAFEMIDEAVHNLTDEEAEKIVADALLDRVEDLAEKINKPKFAAKFLLFATKRFRDRYDIPD